MSIIEAHMENTETKLLNRDEVARALTDHGFDITAGSIGNMGAAGPPAHRWGKRCRYDLAEALEWARARLNAPRRAA